MQLGNVSCLYNTNEREASHILAVVQLARVVNKCNCNFKPQLTIIMLNLRGYKQLSTCTNGWCVQLLEKVLLPDPHF